MGMAVGSEGDSGLCTTEGKERGEKTKMDADPEVEEESQQR
jgi:hypothetical protein